MKGEYLQWDIETFELKLKYAWKISRNTSLSKQNLMILLNNRAVGEAAPNVRWGESIDKLCLEFKSVRHLLPKVNDELDAFRSTISKLKISNSLKCALDMACSEGELKKTLPCETSYSLPILPADNYEGFILDNNLQRFSTLKVKLDTQNIKERISAVKKCFIKNIFIDFNEAFSSFEEIQPYVNFFNENKIKLIEQPFKEGNIGQNSKFKKIFDGDLFLDEDFTDKDLPSNIKNFCDGVNIKIQKTGGTLRAQELLDQAKFLGVKTMVGCMVETSLGVSRSMRLNNVDFYDLDGHLMIQDEPFSLCIENEGKLSLS